jgi:hypothetical protein
MSSDTPSKTGNHTCEHCNKQFSSNATLKVHIETKCNRSQELNIECDFCNTKFVAKSALYKHYKICPTKKEQERQQVLQSLTKEISELKAQNEKSDNKFESRYRDEINEHISKNTVLTKEIEMLKEQILEKDKTILKLETKNENLETQLNKLFEKLNISYPKD